MGKGLVAKLNTFFEQLDITEEVKTAVQMNHDLMVELNRDQMNEGLLSTGDYIKPEYSRFTVQQKRIKGQRYDVVTLRDTGEFQSKMYEIINDNQYDFNSSDTKNAALIRAYSPLIFGLTPESRSLAWRQFLKRTIAEQLNEKRKQK